MIRKILISIGLILVFSTFAFGLTGITAKGFGSYSVLLNPEIEEFGFLDEELTKGEISFVPQILYKRIGVETGYLSIWKDKYPNIYGQEVIGTDSAIPILGILYLNIPSVVINPYIQAGAGIFLLKEKVTVAGEEISGLGYEETELGVTPGAGISVKS